jgi:hypothetical protein
MTLTEKKCVVMRKIVRADRSPLNKKNWVYELECGHEVWQMGRKTRKSELRCDVCERLKDKP